MITWRRTFLFVLAGATVNFNCGFLILYSVLVTTSWDLELCVRDFYCSGKKIPPPPWELRLVQVCIVWIIGYIRSYRKCCASWHGLCVYITLYNGSNVIFFPFCQRMNFRITCYLLRDIYFQVKTYFIQLKAITLKSMMNSIRL